jgi:hypothetical protein
MFKRGGTSWIESNYIEFRTEDGRERRPSPNDGIDAAASRPAGVE